MTHLTLPTLSAAAAILAAAALPAQTIPSADTEDATLSTVDVGKGDIHPVVSLDIRNGDYARGAYDDDGAGLGRLPVHLSVGGAIVLRRRDGDASLFLIGQSSNGFHAPRIGERRRPRGWYESNNLIGLAWRPAQGIDVATAYTIKASPNGVADATHEASVSLLYGAKDAIGRLKPRLAVTRRTKGDSGIFTIVGIAPSFDLQQGEQAATVSLPVSIGVGWRGFYAGGSGDRLYGSGGLSFAKPIRIGRGRATIQADVLALIRDSRLHRLDAPNGTTACVVPYATLSFAVAW